MKYLKLCPFIFRKANFDVISYCSSLSLTLSGYDYLDWIVNWVITAVVTVFHSFIVDQVQYRIESAIFDYTEVINKQISDYLQNDTNIKNLLNFLSRFIKVILEKNISS